MRDLLGRNQLFQVGWAYLYLEAVAAAYRDGRLTVGLTEQEAQELTAGEWCADGTNYPGFSQSDRTRQFPGVIFMQNYIASFASDQEIFPNGGLAQFEVQKVRACYGQGNPLRIVCWRTVSLS